MKTFNFGKKFLPKIMGHATSSAVPKIMKSAPKTVLKAAPQAAKAAPTSTIQQAASQAVKAAPKVAPRPKLPRATRGENLPAWVRQNLKNEYGIRNYNQLRSQIPVMQANLPFASKNPINNENAALQKLLNILKDFGWQ